MALSDDKLNEIADKLFQAVQGYVDRRVAEEVEKIMRTKQDQPQTPSAFRVVNGGGL